MKKQGILFFAERLPPLIGGMEMHAKYFIDYFTDHLEFPIVGIITKDLNLEDYLISKKGNDSIDIKNLAELFDPMIIFFNSGRWIEELDQLRMMFPKTKFVYRTGGNEILQAPLAHNKILDHSLRQSYWVKSLNNSINLLITNSVYTEDRLRALGITCLFKRLVGGVNLSKLKLSTVYTNSKPLTIFCAARFVPYKNHTFMLSVIHKLALRGYDFKLRLAGDGPLLCQAREQVNKANLSSVVEFLGVLDNNKTCNEIASANIYMQLSTDQITKVPGGSYIHSEGMGRSILEAITAGTFIVAGNSGALSEIITRDRGLLVNIDNLEQTTNQIELILRNPPAKLACDDQYSWTNLFKSYEELFENFHEDIAGHRKI